VIVIFILAGLLLGFINDYIIRKNLDSEQSNGQNNVSKVPVILATIALTLLASVVYEQNIDIVFYVLFWNLLLVTAWIDLYTSTINVLLIYAVTAINIVLIVVQNANVVQHLLGGLVGFMAYFLIYLASKAYYKREAFGFGDVILMGSIGFHLGVANGILVAFLSFYIALVFIIIMRIIGKKMKRQTELPFGPYMCLAGLVVSIYGEKLISLYMQIAFG